ncbi:glycosyl transferase family protein [Vibrio sp. 99-70-13A1]|uniref:glycosyl transferase family protein n=1 Tax=Vibrio sp. 99-70-13A1 TaxID=2607601 RepID=UPI0014939289|nr:glycosyl transferase family protein [Vibrio sp. 99-70-13A1]NOH96687.1 glycosyl transferase family protein [Vibrio sp. 99-70-13A1]
MSSIIECIRTVGRGERGRKPLSFDQAYRVMDEYLSGQVGDDQMAMLLMLIRVQNETNEEIAGFVKAFQSRVPDLGADIDWPCYAGKRNDKSSGKPWNLLAAKILSEQGYKILMHGYMDKPSGREHVETYLKSLNVRSAESPEDAKAIMEADSIAYLPLANFAPEARTMISWKNRYGLRTPINTVVRALNPGGGRLGLRGSFHPGFPQLHAEVEHVIGNKSHSVISFKGQSGESEYNPKVSQTVWMSTPEKVESFYWEGSMNVELPTPKECVLGTPDDEIELMANSVVDTMTAILFAEKHNKEEAYALALQYWKQYCAA